MPTVFDDAGVRSNPFPPRIEPLASLDDVRDEWDSLATSTGNVFATWEWNSVWWRHFGGSKALFASACRSDDGRLVGLLPLYLWRRQPFRIVRLIGHDEADQLGPICLPEHRSAIADALRRALVDSRTDMFLAERVARDEGWSALLTATELRTDSSPVVRLDASTWADFLRSRSRNFRDQARRRERRLRDSHEVRFRLVTDAERLGRDLDALFALHHARWSGRRTHFSRRETFHREFAACALERGWLRLWLLEVDGRPRAACYGFRFGEVESFYQSGRDPTWSRYSVGFVTLLHAIREALADGMSEYRLLRGGEAYKFRFADEDRGLETLAVTRTRVSRTALAIAVATRRSRAFQTVRALRRT